MLILILRWCSNLNTQFSSLLFHNTDAIVFSFITMLLATFTIPITVYKVILLVSFNLNGFSFPLPLSSFSPFPFLPTTFFMFLFSWFLFCFPLYPLPFLLSCYSSSLTLFFFLPFFSLTATSFLSPFISLLICNFSIGFVRNGLWW